MLAKGPSMSFGRGSKISKREQKSPKWIQTCGFGKIPNTETMPTSLAKTKISIRGVK